ncbi:erythromycin esterase family protein [Bdellovibrio svalbardensis]|uniref:Erythromycin esterase family protein n=1 Tax=Bdellovibrio svalbardensis TaxID=2972972 RepID=A0ABT6DKK6_9BACT|nr:erythromycin esterase family protein [Bdellovibrio svalbardensis]MDG0817402.1 erythromycin esterase family protein [Bdellovibrio svalbardensis]
MAIFQDRHEAGEALGRKLLSYKEENPLILAIPRGGVPIAAAVAKILGADMDLLMVKKIGAPNNPELAIGAVSESGEPWLNKKLIRRLNVNTKKIEATLAEKTSEVRNQMKKFRGDSPIKEVKGRTLIVVDDGIATGATLQAAVELLKTRKPKKIIVAAPVAPKSSVEEILRVADEVICLETPEPFHAVGNFYHDFTQVEDEDVLAYLHPQQAKPFEAEQLEIQFHDGEKVLKADLATVKDMKCLIVFSHGSGSSRLSPRNRFVAKELNKIGFGTLLADLLTQEEDKDRKNVFDVDLLVSRTLKATEAGLHKIGNMDLPLGFFGASTGAAAALGAAAKTHRKVFAVVSRGGRPDLAASYFRQVKVPTLLIVGGEDHQVIALNEKAARELLAVKTVIVPGATHLFEEPGALEEVVEYAADWFLELYPHQVVGKAPQENVVHVMEDLAHPIKADGDWEDLIRKIAKSRIVMLGEASHGSAEFYTVRRMISERLIRDHGFDFIAVEGDWPDCQKLHDYIRTGEGKSAKDIMRRFERWPTWMWANDEAATMIEWMQSYQAGFYGLDVYSLFESMDYVMAYTKQVDTGLAKEIKSNYSCFEPFRKNEKAYAKFLMEFEEGCKGEVMESLQKMLRLRVEKINTAHRDLFNAQQNARIVKNAEDYYRAMLFGGAESWNVRDRHMMETLEILLNRKKDSKCIVWAHNSHIGDYHATDMLEEGYVNLGGLAREKFGLDQVSLVGFGTYQGEVLASPAWDGPETVTKLPAAKEGSFENYCHKVSQDLRAPRFYMNFDSEARKSVLGTRRYGHRAVGVVYDPRFEAHGRNYVPTVIAQRYDSFVFIDKTSALRAIPTLKNWGDFPETWPAGI